MKKKDWSKVEIPLHPEKGASIFPNKEECSEETTKSFIYGSSSGSLFTFGQLPGLFFPHLAHPRTLPNMWAQLFSKMDSGLEAYGEACHHLLWGGSPSYLTPKELFCMCAVFPLPKDGKHVTSWSFTQTGLLLRPLIPETSPVVQWLRFYTPSAGGLGSIPGPGTRSNMPQLRDPTCCN